MTYTIQNILGIQFLFFLSIFIKNKMIKKIIFNALIISLAIYLGARAINVGTDTHVYAREYLSGNGGYFGEVLFKKLGYFLYRLNFDIVEYFITISLLNTFFYYLGYKLNTESNSQFYLAFWLFLFNTAYLFGSINILRQSLAQGVFIISLFFLKEKSIKKFIVFILFGYCFHTSIFFWIFLPLFMKCYYKFIRKRRLLFFISLMLISELSIKLLCTIPKFYYYYYFIKSNNSMYIKVLILITLFVLTTAFKKIDEFDEMIIFYTIILICFFIHFPLLSGRLIYYISAYLPIVLTKVLKGRYELLLLLLLGWMYHIALLFYPSTIQVFNFC